MDSRHFKRIKIVQEIYSLFFNPCENIKPKTQEIIKNQEIVKRKLIPGYKTKPDKNKN